MTDTHKFAFCDSTLIVAIVTLGRGNSLVLVDSPPRSLQVSKQNLRKGRWSSSAVASNSSRRRKLQNQTCVSGYA